MPTLYSDTIQRWIEDLVQIESTLNQLWKSNEPIPGADYSAVLNARISATVMRKQLIQIAVAPVEVEMVESV